MLTAFHVDTLFSVLLTLSTAVFLLLWLMHMTTLLRQRDKEVREHYISIIIWTVTPAAIIIGLGLLGPSLVHNLQYLP